MLSKKEKDCLFELGSICSIAIPVNGPIGPIDSSFDFIVLRITKKCIVLRNRFHEFWFHKKDFSYSHSTYRYRVIEGKLPYIYRVRAF